MKKSEPLQRLLIASLLLVPPVLLLSLFFVADEENRWASPPEREVTITALVAVAVLVFVRLVKPRSGQGTSWLMVLVRGFLCSLPMFTGLALTYTADWPAPSMGPGLMLFVLASAFTVAATVVELMPTRRSG